eukprot:scaffold134217_cov39-Tisochrysis_lutea.AAC.2
MAACTFACCAQCHSLAAAAHSHLQVRPDIPAHADATGLMVHPQRPIPAQLCLSTRAMRRHAPSLIGRLPRCLQHGVGAIWTLGSDKCPERGAGQQTGHGAPDWNEQK